MSSSNHFHAVRFYQDEDSLSRTVADFLGDGLASRQPAIVIATKPHLAAIERELSRLSFDVRRLRDGNSLLYLDAEQTLSTFMTNGRPDSGRFNDEMREVIRMACADRRGCTVRAYGEMVDVLWKNRMHEAAVRLEVLWNALVNTYDFSLLCGYSMGHFYKDVGLERICRLHTHLLSAEAEPAPLSAA